MTIEQYTRETWITGSGHVANVEGTIKSGQILADRAPLGQVSATGEFAIWNPAAVDGTDKAVRLAPFAIDATSGAVIKQLVSSGTFNPDLVAWPNGTTAAQKAAAFVGTPIGLQKPG